MQTRLLASSPHIAETIRNASQLQKKNLAASLASWALNKTSYQGTLPTNAFEAQVILNNLDEKYFKLQAQEASGSATQSEVLTAFNQARAMHALLFSLLGNAEEAAYESIIATNEPQNAEKIIKEAMA